MPNLASARFWNVTTDLLIVVSKTGEIINANPSWTRVLGWTEKDVSGKHFSSLVHPDDLDLTMGQFKNLSGDGTVIGFDNRYRAKNGKYKWLRWNAVPQDGQFYCSAQDITKEMMTQRRLVTQEEEADLREQFLAVLSHDLRNPIAAISSGARILGRMQQEERALPILQAIQNSVSRMDDMLSDLMDFTRARLGSDLAADVTKKQNLSNAVLQTVEELRLAYPDSQIALEQSEEIIIECDISRIKQVMSNLISNAIKHGEDGTPVNIVVKTIDKGVWLYVQNQGPTIPPSARKDLFKPYVRGTEPQRVDGLGLGLYIANEITIAHHGKMDFTSDDGITKFSVFLPTTQPK